MFAHSEQEFEEAWEVEVLVVCTILLLIEDEWKAGLEEATEGLVVDLHLTLAHEELVAGSVGQRERAGKLHVSEDQVSFVGFNKAI